MDKIIWQPIQLYNSKADFGVILDNEFVRMMISKKLAIYKGSATINLNDEKLHKNREESASKYLKKFN
ncbi:MAG: hypothetical protein AABW56_03920 [Nanoarchaeota archaeon]